MPGKMKGVHHATEGGTMCPDVEVDGGIIPDVAKRPEVADATLRQDRKQVSITGKSGGSDKPVVSESVVGPGLRCVSQNPVDSAHAFLEIQVGYVAGRPDTMIGDLISRGEPGVDDGSVFGVIQTGSIPARPTAVGSGKHTFRNAEVMLPEQIAREYRVSCCCLGCQADVAAALSRTTRGGLGENRGLERLMFGPFSGFPRDVVRSGRLGRARSTRCRSTWYRGCLTRRCRQHRARINRLWARMVAPTVAT